MRPFYINAKIDGRKTDLTGGTKSKDGSHHISIYQRDNGSITTPIKIEQYSTMGTDDDGKPFHHLHTRVYYQGEVICHHTTYY